MDINREYRRLRGLGWEADGALRAAKTREEWDKAGGIVRITIIADEMSGIEDLEGDMFNPIVNPDIPPARLAAERAALIDRIERDGVWGVIGEYFDGEAWQHGDSCWGFVGEDWKDSGYDTDIMDATLAAMKAATVCPTCGRPAVQKTH